MTEANRLLVALMSFLCLVSVATVSAQQRKLGTVRQVANPDTSTKRNPTDQISDRSTVQVEPSVQPNSIRIHVHYPKEYGYVTIDSRTQWAYSCDAFSVDATRLRRPRYPNEGQGELLMTVAKELRMRSEGGRYICDFTVSSVPLNEPISIRMSMAGQEVLTQPWQAGSNPQPPSGSERMILYGSREVVLTPGQPSSVLEFEMAYRSHLRRQP